MMDRRQKQRRHSNFATDRRTYAIGRENPHKGPDRRVGASDRRGSRFAETRSL